MSRPSPSFVCASAATAAAFSEISLDEKDVENSSLTERVSNVFKEAFVGVKKRVDQLEKLNRTP